MFNSKSERVVARCLTTMAFGVVLPGCAFHEPMISKVVAYRAAQKAGDFPQARTYLSDNPRVWYEEREGEGSPLKLKAGRWSWR